MAIRSQEDIQADREAIIERLMPNLKKQKPKSTTHMRWDDLATLCGLDIVALQEAAGVIHVETVVDAEQSADERLRKAEERIEAARKLEAEADAIESNVREPVAQQAKPVPTNSAAKSTTPKPSASKQPAKTASRVRAESNVQAAKEELVDEGEE